ncbi:cupin domain-containing protein [Bacteroidales bacterium OttesenSCG-928-M11]|jgi:quercetin dioxygenase-like cupin family protein|nr:cupin domain-containing protein [Bacteroidales bacterium OttesenSCG-928-M11]
MNELFEKGAILNMAEMIEYSVGGVISKQVLKNDAGNITLFSFDKGQGLSEHTAPFDAMVEILDGEAEISIDGKPLVLIAGQSVIMPAGIPHALYASKQFKMLLTMIKG